MAEELTNEELKKYTNNLTVGKLREFLEQTELSDDALVLMERVEDVYFDKHRWGVYLHKGEHYHSLLQFNKDVDNKEYGDDLSKATEEELKNYKEQYFPAWYCFREGEDKDKLFIGAHY